MKLINIKYSWLVLLLLFNFRVVAQTKTPANDKAFQILDKAIGNVFSSDNIGIYFEGIVFGIQKPEDIFTLPVYKVFRGGFLFIDSDKFQIELGLMKSMSDGKLTVVVDEQSKTMIVDSVRKNEQDDINMNELQDLVSEDFKDGTLEYQGIVTINNKKCHKIKSIVKSNTSSTEILYWVDVVNEQLYLMAEYQNNGYNVYWFNKVGKAPAKHIYTIYLPKNAITTYHGYTVIDNRFSETER